MFLSRVPFTNYLSNDLNENPNLPIYKILSDSELMNSVQNELPELLEYFKRDNGIHLQELFDIALTNKLNNDKIDFRHNRNASNVLSTPSSAFQEYILNSPIMIKSLTEFISNSKFFRDTSFSGHFQRIIQSYQYFTNGTFIEQLPGISDFLLNNIDLLSYKQLLVLLIVDFMDNFKDKDILIKISNIVNSKKEPHNLFATFVLSDIMHERPDFKFLFQRNIIVNLIEKAAHIKNEEGNIHFFEIFNALRLITKNYSLFNKVINTPNNSFNSNSDSINDSNSTSADDDRAWLNDIFNKYVKEFSFETGKANERSFSAFPFFSEFLFLNYLPNPKDGEKNNANIYLDKLINLFFYENAPTNFTLSFLSGVDKMDDESLLYFIEKNNILKKIIDSNINMPYESVKGASFGHIFQLALTIFNRKLDATKYLTKEKNDKSIITMASHAWSFFLATQVLIRNSMINECLQKVNDFSDDTETETDTETESYSS